MPKRSQSEKMDDSIRIGFDAKRVFHNRTGLGNYSRNLLSGLTTLYPQNEYYLYTPRPPASGTSDFFTPGANIQIKTPRKYYHKKFSALWRSVYLKEFLEQDEIQVYHGLSHELPFRRKPEIIKTVVTIHDLIFLKYPELYPMIDRAIYEWKVKNACKIADKIIAISEQTKQDIMEYYHVPEEKIAVIYQNCDEAFGKPLPKKELDRVMEKYDLPKNYFLYVGSITERKNVLKLVRAFDYLKKYSDMDMVLVGSGGNHKEQVEQYIKQNNLTKRVKMYHEVPDEDLPALYRQALVFVYPSIYEGFGIPIIEALYSKVPVITTMNGCFPEAAGPGAVYVNPESANDIAQAMENFLLNPNLRTKLATAGYKYVQKFTAKSFAEQTMQVYREVLGK